MVKSMVSDIGEQDFVNVAANLTAGASYYVPTGCAVIDMQLSGKLINGGIPGGSIVGVSGETQSGKSRISVQACRNFLAKFPNDWVLYIDTENALKLGATNSKASAERAKQVFGEHHDRVFVMSMANHIEDVYAKIVMWLNMMIAKDARRKDAKCFIVLDSLGMMETRALSAAMIKHTTTKKRDTGVRLNSLDAVKADAGRNAKAKAAMFRGIMNLVPKANATMLVCNHIYDNIGSMSTAKEIAGGGGLKFGAQALITLFTRSNSNLIAAEKGKARAIESMLWKGRDTKPYSKVTTDLHFEKGGFQYYSGLLAWAVEAGAAKMVGKRYCITDPDVPEKNRVCMGKKEVETNPEKFFTPQSMIYLNEVAEEYFGFGDFSYNIQGIMSKTEQYLYEQSLDEVPDEVETDLENLTMAAQESGVTLDFEVKS